MDSVNERLLHVEEDLLFAIIEGGTVLHAFNDSWSTLRNDIAAGVQSNLLAEQTVSLAHAVSSRVAAYASAFHDLDIDTHVLTSDMTNELEAILNCITLEDTSPPIDPSLTSTDELHLDRHSDVNAYIRHSAFQPHAAAFSLPTAVNGSSQLPSWSSLEESDGAQLSMKLAAGRKRTALSLEECDDNVSMWSDAQRPLKRSRKQKFLYDGFNDDSLSIGKTHSAELGSAIACNSSANRRSSSSFPYYNMSGDHALPHLPLIELDVDIPDTTSSHRKQRLNHANASPTSKRLCASAAGPRAVSDPLPTVSRNETDVPKASLESWDTSNCQSPLKALLADIDSYLPLDIDVFHDWSAASDEKGEAQNTSRMDRTMHSAQQIGPSGDCNLQVIIPGSLDASTVLPTLAGDGLISLPGVVTDTLTEIRNTNPEPPIGPALFFRDADNIPSPSPSYYVPPSGLSYKSSIGKEVAPRSLNSCLWEANMPATHLSSGSFIPEYLVASSKMFQLHSVFTGFQPLPDVTPASQAERSISPYESPPSFLESMDAFPTAPWNQLWDSFESLPDVGSASPPPPYCPSPDFEESFECFSDAVKALRGDVSVSPFSDLPVHCSDEKNIRLREKEAAKPRRLAAIAEIFQEADGAI